MAREKPIPRSARKKLNRGRLRSRDDDTVKQISVGLMDIDAAIMFYFNNTIQPMVEENGESIKVPLMYSNPERWAMVQKNGYLVDNKNHLLGSINDGDVRRSLLKGNDLNTKIKKIYYRKTISLDKDLTNNEIIKILKKKKFHLYRF